MYDADEKVAEGFIMFVRKDLFLANNLFSMSIFLSERKRELQDLERMVRHYCPVVVCLEINQTTCTHCLTSRLLVSVIL